VHLVVIIIETIRVKSIWSQDKKHNDSDNMNFLDPVRETSE